MKSSVLVLLAALTILCLGSCKAPAPPAATGSATPAAATPGGGLTVGVNAELTGSIPVVGQSCKNAAELAV